MANGGQVSAGTHRGQGQQVRSVVVKQGSVDLYALSTDLCYIHCNPSILVNWKYLSSL